LNPLIKTLNAPVPAFQSVLTWPGQWVAGHIGQPGAGFAGASNSGNVQGVFTGGSSGPGGQSGVVGSFNNGTINGVANNNGNVTRFSRTLPSGGFITFGGACYIAVYHIGGISVCSPLLFSMHFCQHACRRSTAC
jgi:hypothetical protein